MISTTLFSSTLAAVAQCHATRAEPRRGARAIGSAPPDWQQRNARLRAEAAHDAANVAAVNAYADELLPAILGGIWRRSVSGSLIRYGSAAEQEPLGYPLIDHELAFRRAGSLGPLTWRNGMLASEPYDALRKDGSPTDAALTQARRLRAELGIGIWASRELSRWYPGWTSLLLLSRGLRPADAAVFGFIALA